MQKRVPTRMVAFGGSPQTVDVAGFPIEVVRTWGRLRGRVSDPIGPSFIPALLWADVVHCHQARSGLTALAALLCRPLRKSMFVTDHAGGGVNWVRRARLGRWIDAHLSQSEFAVGTLPHVGRRTSIIHAGVDTQVFAPADGKVPGEVVFVGRILPHKGVEHAIRALPEGTHLSVYGQPYDADYLAFLQREPKGRHVSFHQGSTDDQVARALSRACVAVMPSVFDDYRGNHQDFPELLGLAALEAMACGTAVVVSNAGGMPEIVDSSYGSVVEPGDHAAIHKAILPFITDPNHAATCGVRARARVLNDFTWAAVAERCISQYAAARVQSC